MSKLSYFLRLFTAFLLCAFSFIGFTAEYVGSKTCVNCHEDAYQDWQGSQHQLAMQHASKESILGDFNNAEFISNGKVNRFYTKGDQYWVNIEGPDGKFHDYQIKYTFGVEPLQQYMVEFDDGRVQLIPFTWDARLKSEGGQRWYDLYPDKTTTDEFYWTNTGQNWNFMCADCHSTNLNKNYNPETNEYKTTWSEISVGCEACHGPGSEHLNLTKDNKNTDTLSTSNFGFNRDLSKAVKEWVYEEGKPALQPRSIEKTDQVQVCAQCHSRRTQISESNDHVAGEFQDRYLLSMITPQLYHNDGQIYDEDYVYGSFLQSKMAEKGVTCSNCHNPHSAELAVPEEAVCAQCHSPADYSPEKHTFHEANSEASQCTTCHMPTTTYMQVDPRRDHSWQIPRPNLSELTQTPNVCTSCHEGESNKWANNSLKKWFPNSKHNNQQHFSVAFYASSINHASAGDALINVAQDSTQSDIIRASSLQRLAAYPSDKAKQALKESIKNDNDMVRIGAIKGSAGYAFKERWILLQPLLTDPVYAVRTEAAGALVRYWSALTVQQRAEIKKPLAEYIDIQMFNRDRGFGYTNLANVYRSQGKNELAIEAYQQAMKVEPIFINSYINLADLYRSQKQEIIGFDTLMKGIIAKPDSGPLNYTAGLSLLRQKQSQKAANFFKKATELTADNPQYWLVYGLSLENINLTTADYALNQAFKLSGNPEHLYARCDMLLKHQSAGVKAKACLEDLTPYAPANMMQQLKARLQ
ncbi:HEAT repeat domain-containing protein [Moritella dasanensis]|uniref:HEAT repeat domain-containing protein n=1 Tax=Moritella dasanensis TaxID=428031 RepID=UPI0002F21C4B|nr:HEAT repeat domain-containing protein [Moritella dasanensis]